MNLGRDVPNMAYSYDLCIAYFEKVFGVKYFKRDVKNQRHVFLHPAHEKDKSFYVIYKRDYFHTFSEQFLDFVQRNPEYKGYGESINEVSLIDAIGHNADYICFIRQSGDLHFVNPRLWKKFAETHNLIRVQDREHFVKRADFSGKHEVVHEKTYSIPIKLFQELDAVTPDMASQKNQSFDPGKNSAMDQPKLSAFLGKV